MKKIALTLIYFLSAYININAQTNFDLGFKEGFKNGYCYTTNQAGYYCNPPLPPLPPLPQLNENRNSYQDGYNRGFLYGQERRRSDDNNSLNNNVNPNPNVPQFNSYVPQSPITNLTPQERDNYYAAKARQEQEVLQSLAAFEEDILAVDYERKDRMKRDRLIRKIPKLDKKIERELNKVKKEIRKREERIEKEKIRKALTE